MIAVKTWKNQNFSYYLSNFTKNLKLKTLTNLISYLILTIFLLMHSSVQAKLVNTELNGYPVQIDPEFIKTSIIEQEELLHDLPILGLSLIKNNGEIVLEINGQQSFPLASAYQFHIAYAFALFASSKNLSLKDYLSINYSDFQSYEHSYSQLYKKTIEQEKSIRKEVTVKDIHYPISRLLGAILKDADDMASDILCEAMGGISKVNAILDTDFNALSIEMFQNPATSLANKSTPHETVELLRRFAHDMHLKREFKQFVLNNMFTHPKSLMRVSGALASFENIDVYSKTGTGYYYQDHLQVLNEIALIKKEDEYYYFSIFYQNIPNDTNGLITEQKLQKLVPLIFSRLQN